MSQAGHPTAGNGLSAIAGRAAKSVSASRPAPEPSPYFAVAVSPVGTPGLVPPPPPDVPEEP